METKFVLIAQAETIYNRNNVAFFGYPEQSGSWYIFRKEFSTQTDAANYLSSRVHDNYVNGIIDQDEYESMIWELYEYDRVNFNGVTCNIEEVYESI